MPRENDVVSGSNNSAYAELAGEGPGESSAIESSKPSIGRQEGQATIRTDKNLDREINDANRRQRESKDRPSEGSREDAQSSDRETRDSRRETQRSDSGDAYEKENSF